MMWSVMLNPMIVEDDDDDDDDDNNNDVEAHTQGF